jgi:hypothetical protein
MTLEMLLAIGCLAGNNSTACGKMGEAYIKYEKIDEIATQINYKIERQYPVIIYTTTLLSSVEQRKINVPVTHGIYFGFEFPSNSESKISGGWSYGF